MATPTTASEKLFAVAPKPSSKRLDPGHSEAFSLGESHRQAALDAVVETSHTGTDAACDYSYGAPTAHVDERRTEAHSDRTRNADSAKSGGCGAAATSRDQVSSDDPSKIAVRTGAPFILLPDLNHGALPTPTSTNTTISTGFVSSFRCRCTRSMQCRALARLQAFKLITAA